MLPTVYVTVRKTCLRPEPRSQAAATIFVQIDILVNITNFFSDGGGGAEKGMLKIIAFSDFKNKLGCKIWGL